MPGITNISRKSIGEIGVEKCGMSMVRTRH